MANRQGLQQKRHTLIKQMQVNKVTVTKRLEFSWIRTRTGEQEEDKIIQTKVTSYELRVTSYELWKKETSRESSFEIETPTKNDCVV